MTSRRNTLYENETRSLWWLPVFVLPWAIFYLLVLLNYRSLPVPLTIKDEVNLAVYRPSMSLFMFLICESRFPMPTNLSLNEPKR